MGRESCEKAIVAVFGSAKEGKRNKSRLKSTRTRGSLKGRVMAGVSMAWQITSWNATILVSHTAFQPSALFPALHGCITIVLNGQRDNPTRSPDGRKGQVQVLHAPRAKRRHSQSSSSGVKCCAQGRKTGEEKIKGMNARGSGHPGPTAIAGVALVAQQARLG